ncbi:MAG: squalene synthase HpnC [Minwuiales bacterium]|nr:squalene synthase HpnC [Minwuiales bacterium]
MSEAIETPSGKNTGTENFPVGSWLLPARLRPHVATFYAFARAADDIADNGDLTPDDKVARLAAFDAVLTGDAPEDPALEKAVRMRQSLAETGVTNRHCRDVLIAFTEDATKTRYANWSELARYCSYSASPVGRYVLDLHGEPPEIYVVSDPLCDALQVINHLQDCADDYRVLDRVYLPQDWMADAGVTVRDLDAPFAKPGLRRVLDQCLDLVEEWLDTASLLPAGCRDVRLGMETAAILSLAKRLTAELRRRDPLAEPVKLGKPSFLMTAGTGAAGLLFRRLMRRPQRLVGPAPNPGEPK